MIPLPMGKQMILIVDDLADNLKILSSVLQPTYRTHVTTSGTEALSLALRSPAPDLILLDVLMPAMNGFEVCRRLKSDPRLADIPVIFLTGAVDPEDEQAGLDVGAVDYITKPFSAPLVLARVKAHLQVKVAQDLLKSQNAFLEAEVVRRTEEVAAIQDAAMIALGSLAETRDNETGAHIQRTQHFVRSLATHARGVKPFGAQLGVGQIETMFKCAPLHDIGKVGIPDTILLKPGPLSPPEFEVMKTHTTLGARAIEQAERRIDNPRSFLAVARQIALTHHERWDGTGYPGGLKGEETPLAGRIMALADVYDALRSQRIYKPAKSHRTAVQEMLSLRGHFDPRLFEVFLEIEGDWEHLYDELTS